MTPTLTRANLTVGATDQADDRAVLEALRLRVAERKKNQPAVPQLAQVLTIVADLIDGAPLADTAAKMGLSSLRAAEQMVFDVVATYGTWLSHSIGKADVECTHAADEIQMTLFASAPQSGHVVVPVGYEPGGPHRRDVDKALATIVYYRPSDEVTARFVARTYAPRQSKLSYPVIAGVWGFAKRGRLGTIDKVSDDLIFQCQAVEAFDLLDVARQDAVDAIRELCVIDADATESIVRACDRSYWIDESSLGNLRNLAETIAAATPQQLAELEKASERLALATKRLQRELSVLSHRCQEAPHRYLPAQISDLTLGQVRRICQSAGIRVEAESRSEETDIRNSLKQMGFGQDADRLIPEALRCASMGLLDSFWAVMQARLEGDSTWAVQLQELSGS